MDPRMGSSAIETARRLCQLGVARVELAVGLAVRAGNRPSVMLVTASYGAVRKRRRTRSNAAPVKGNYADALTRRLKQTKSRAVVKQRDVSHRDVIDRGELVIFAQQRQQRTSRKSKKSRTDG